jgi:hypothetical protein
MSDLFKAADEIASQFFSNPAFKQQTIAERDKYNAKILFGRAHLELNEENLRHQVAIMQINRKINNFTTLRKILDGSPGFIRCSQGQLVAESGFTTIGEVIGYIGKPQIDLSMEPMSCAFGMELWAIDDKGMMNLVDYKRDSSD